MGWFYEFITVLAFSRRIQWSLIVGLSGCVFITFLGEYKLANFELHWMMAPFTDDIKDKMGQYYEKAAIGCLFSSLGMAAKFYRRDRKRYF